MIKKPRRTTYNCDEIKFVSKNFYFQLDKNIFTITMMAAVS